MENLVIVIWRIRHRGDFDDVRIELGQILMDLGDTVRCLSEIMIADNSLGRAVTLDLIRDVVFKVDVISPVNDRRP